MVSHDIIKDIAIASPSKIVMLVIDGLGGLPESKSGKTELEIASTPHLDKLAQEGICGLIDPVSPGITSGSGPGHLALFGYDPLKFTIGRGVLEALGIDFDLKDTDVAARGNFCTLDDRGVIIDRRAGRISTEKSRQLCGLLSCIKLENTQLFVLPVRDHRFLLVFRGNNLSAAVSDTDPQRIGVAPNTAMPINSEGKGTANLIKQFVDIAAEILSRYYPANMVLLRGFSRLPHFPSIKAVSYTHLTLPTNREV